MGKQTYMYTGCQVVVALATSSGENNTRIAIGILEHVIVNTTN